VKTRAVKTAISNNKQRWNHTEPVAQDKTNPRAPGLRLTVGVMGSASGPIAARAMTLARQLGRAIAAQGCVTITGACPGLPFAAAEGAYQQGGLVIGISPGLSLDEHREKYNSPVNCHDVLIFTGSGLMGREVVNIRSSDMVAILGGRSGTLGELAIAYDEGKLIGVLTDTGGISDMVSSILEACKKNTGARVLYDDDPRRLVERMVRTYRSRHYKKPSIFESRRQNG
jgi:uncharacterized protein (TIGR00725 family)